MLSLTIKEKLCWFSSRGLNRQGGWRLEGCSLASYPPFGCHNWGGVSTLRWERARSLIIPTCARLQWEGRDEAISCLFTGTTKSLYTSVSYFLFWHNQFSKLRRHDRIWQVPRTLAKLDKEEAVRCREGDELAWTLCLLSPLSVTWAGCVARRGCRVGQNNPRSAEGDRHNGESFAGAGCGGKNVIKLVSSHTWFSFFVSLTGSRIFPVLQVICVERALFRIIGILRLISHLTYNTW